MSNDLFRVVIAPGFNDGLGGVTMVDGVSTPTSLIVATRIALNLGGRVIRADEEPRPVVAPASPPPSAVLPSKPAPPDAPVVSPAHAAPPAPSPLPSPPPRLFTPAPTHRRR